MSDFEDRLRRSLHDGSDPAGRHRVDADAVLSSVRRGAARRRRRRVASTTVAAVCVLSVGGYVTTAGLTGDDPVPTAHESLTSDQTQAPEPSMTETTRSSAGTPPSRTQSRTTNSQETASDPTHEPDASGGSSVTQPPSPEDSGSSGGDGGSPLPGEESDTGAGQARWAPARTVAVSTQRSGRVWALMASSGAACEASDSAAGDEARCLQPYVSDDGGESWTPLGQVPPELATWDPALQGSYVDRIRFTDDGQHGWIWGSTVLATHDGGRTWQQVDVASEYSTYAVDSNSEYVYVSEIGTDVRNYRAPVDSDDFEALEPPVDGVANLQATATMVFGYSFDGEGSTPTYYRGTEQGTSWETITPCGDMNPTVGLSASDDVVWALCQAADDASAYYLARSTDEGATFQTARGGVVWKAPGSRPTLLAIDSGTVLIDGARVNQGRGRPDVEYTTGSGYRSTESFRPLWWRSPVDGYALALGADQQPYAYDPTNGWSRLDTPGG